jgi:hypothetical protein
LIPFDLLTAVDLERLNSHPNFLWGLPGQSTSAVIRDHLCENVQLRLTLEQQRRMAEDVIR